MKDEQRYLLHTVCWIALWWTLPPVAMILMVYMVCKHFSAIRANRRLQARAERLHRADNHWAHREGFGEYQTNEEPDAADWWKK